MKKAIPLFVLLLSASPASAETPAADPKDAVRRLYDEVVNGGNPDLLARFVDDACVDRTDPSGAGACAENLREFLATARRAFPDFRVTVEDVIAEGDRAAVVYRARGTQTGEFMGAPPSGKAFAVGGVDVVRLSGGKIVEHWGALDELSLLRQLGLAWPPAVDDAGPEDDHPAKEASPEAPRPSTGTASPADGRE